MTFADQGSVHEVMWRPDEDQIANANLTAFLTAHDLPDFDALYARAAADPDWFWDQMFKWFDYRFTRPYSRVRDDSDGKPWMHWCIDGETNVALNCLDRRRGTPEYDHPAIVWEGEDGERIDWTYADLDRETCRFAAGLQSLGLGRNDVIGMYLPNVPQAAVALLAVAKIGAIVLPMFSGFGEDAILSRLEHSGARAVITIDGSPRRGKVVAAKPILDQALANAPDVEHVIVLQRTGIDVDWKAGRDHWWHDLTDGQPDDVPTVSCGADDPFLLVYTSGTTGKPKGVVHTHSGFPMKACADLGLMMDFKAGDRILWMSDMGWLVGPLLVFGPLLMGGTVVLVEGAPDYPQADRMWSLVERHRVSYLGVAPTVVRAAMVHGTELLDGKDLSSLRVFASTGEAWNPDGWIWLNREVGKGRLPIMNYSGGTEMLGILGCSMLHPQKPCSFSVRLPGTGADIVDPDGNSVPAGEVGELVMRTPPLGLTQGLWQDRERYLDGYWNVIPDLWFHGDFASRDEDGLMYVHGRSDDTMKIAGKRTGPSEIEDLVIATGTVKEVAAIGIKDPVKGQAVACVVVPRDGLDEDDVFDQVTDAIVRGLGGAYRPKDLVAVEDLPKTRNMKVMRRVIRAVYEGRDAGDLSSLVNPEAVDMLQQALFDR